MARASVSHSASTAAVTIIVGAAAAVQSSGPPSSSLPVPAPFTLAPASQICGRCRVHRALQPSSLSSPFSYSAPLSAFSFGSRQAVINRPRSGQERASYSSSSSSTSSCGQCTACLESGPLSPPPLFAGLRKSSPFAAVARSKSKTVTKGRRIVVRAEEAGLVDDAETPAVHPTNVPGPAKPVSYKKLLITLVDKNIFLSDSSKKAIATGASLAATFGGSVTVLVIDPLDADYGDTSARAESIRWHLAEAGSENFEILEKKGPPVQVLGDVADDLDSDLVVISSLTIAPDVEHCIDGNHFSDFVPCPLFIVP